MGLVAPGACGIFPDQGLNHCKIVKVKVTQSCLRPQGLPAFFVHGILQARILEWVAILFPSPGIKPRFPALQADALYCLNHQGISYILNP